MPNATAHDAETLTGGWLNVEDHIGDALLIAWDGCHKIYLAMDEIEAAWFRAEYPHIVTGTPDEMLATLHQWFDDSCSLRLISAVAHNAADPNAGFTQLIRQFATDEVEEDEDDEEPYDHDEEGEDY